MRRAAEPVPAYGPLGGSWGRLAAELALGLEDPVEVAKRHGIDKAALLVLLEDERFAATVQQAAERLDAVHEVAERIRLKGELAVEAGIEFMFQIMADINAPSSARVQAFSALKSLTTLGQPEVQHGGFTLRIILPEGQTPVVIDASSLDVDNNATNQDQEADNGMAGDDDVVAAIVPPGDD